MQVELALNRLADRFGLISEYHDLHGGLQIAPVDTKRALLRAMGLQLDNDAAVLAALQEAEAVQAERLIADELILPAGQAVQIQLAGAAQWVLHFDADLGLAPQEGRGDSALDLPPLPVGVHKLELRTKNHRESAVLLARPNHAPSLHDICGQGRLWGVTAALYGLQSSRNLGVGDYADLAVAAEGLARGGAAFLGVNPIHNLGWADDQVISPYSPSTREFLNSWHLACDQLQGLQALPDAAALVAASRDALGPVGPGAQIQYGAQRALIKPLLRQLFSLFQAQAPDQARHDFAAFRARAGQRMQEFAGFECLSSLHGPDWRQWPASAQALRGGQDLGINPDELSFHIWLQWQAETQLAAAQSRALAAGMPLGLYLDLAVGARPGGAETFCGAGSVAAGVSLGAPPDQFNPTGQRWNLTAFAPNKLRETGYADLRRTLASSMRHAGVLRVDHILGMNRSYLFPDDGAPGGYLRQPFASLLAVIAIEAAKSNTVVIGEDLGLVPNGFRDALSGHGFYGYSVLQYERDEGGQFRQSEDLRGQSLTCFGTHDSPSMRGFYNGHDIGLRQTMGWEDDQSAADARHKRQSDIESVGGNDSFETFRHNVHARIAWSSAAMISVQLDDMLGIQAPQNLPGTVDEYPNWRLRCPIGVDEIASIENLAQTSAIMRESGRAIAPLPPREGLK